MTDTTVHPIPPGMRVNVDPNATWSLGAPNDRRTFRTQRHDPAACYTIDRGPDAKGDYHIDDGGDIIFAAARFVTPWQEDHHPIPVGTRVKLDPNFTHADGDPCLDAPRSVWGSCYVVHTPDDYGDYVLRVDGNPNRFHAAARFVSPYVEPAEDNTPEPVDAPAVTHRQALAIIGAGFVGMARLGYGNLYESDSGARAIMRGDVPDDLVAALATIGEHGLRNMGGGR